MTHPFPTRRSSDLRDRFRHPDLGDIAALNQLPALRLRIEVEREVIVAAAIVAVLEMARVDLVVAHAETAEFDRRTVSPAYQCDRPGLRQIFEAVAADRLQRDRAVTEGDTAPLHAVAIRTCLPEIGVQLRQPPSVCRQLCRCIRPDRMSDG